MNLFNSGLLNPQNAQMAVPVIKMMTFEGKDEILRYVQEGMTLQNQLMQMQQQMDALTKENIALKGIPQGIPQQGQPIDLQRGQALGGSVWAT